MKHRGLNQLLAAALINERFCETLLRHPRRALAAGYFNQTFSLTPEEQDLVLGIRAERLEDFAAAVYHWLSSNRADGGFSSAVRPLDVGSAPASYPGTALDAARLAVAA